MFSIKNLSVTSILWGFYKYTTIHETYFYQIYRIRVSSISCFWTLLKVETVFAYNHLTLQKSNRFLIVYLSFANKSPFTPFLWVVCAFEFIDDGKRAFYKRAFGHKNRSKRRNKGKNFIKWNCCRLDYLNWSQCVERMVFNGRCVCVYAFDVYFKIYIK